MESAYQYRDRDGAVVVHGPTFDEPSYLWDMGTWFKLPLGYQNPWPLKDHANAIVDVEDYKEALAELGYKGFDPATGRYDPKLVTSRGIDASFAFWMPSLRYVERNRFWVADLRPCEAGRPRPTDDEYVVQFSIEWPFLPNSETSDATIGLRRAQERLRKDGRLPAQDRAPRIEHNLNGPISGTKDYDIYDDDGDLAVMFSCLVMVGEERAPNPLCKGFVWQRLSDLVLFMLFPADQGQVGEEQKWREPVMAAIGLAKKWRWEVPAKPND